MSILKCSAHINKTKDNINIRVNKNCNRMNKHKLLKNKWIYNKQADFED